MKALCHGCLLGFHAPEDHLPRASMKQATYMQALTKTYKRQEDVEEAYADGILCREERIFLTTYLRGHGPDRK